MKFQRQLPGDWCDVGVPDNVEIDPTAYVASSQCFESFRSRRPVGLTAAEGAGLYYGCMFDVGPAGRVSLGRCTLVTAAVFCADLSIELGDHCLVSWNVVIMDSYRLPVGPRQRRAALRNLTGERGLPDDPGPARPVRLGNNVWVGFDSVVLPGVTIGDGAIVGCRSVVADDVPPYAVVGGNPAKVIRYLSQGSAEFRVQSSD